MYELSLGHSNVVNKKTVIEGLDDKIYSKVANYSKKLETESTSSLTRKYFSLFLSYLKSFEF